ncbi:MAG: sporulation protein YqfD [Lachnospirales bacterium]
MRFIFNFVKGYVEVEVLGYAINRFLNLCNNKEIPLWNVNNYGSKLICSTSIKGFYLMRGFGRKTGCKVRIKGKTGIPFLMHRYRKRKILLFGCLFFLFTINFLSRFIWNIEIEGNTTINNYEVIEVLKENDIYIGKYNNEFNMEELEKIVQKNFPKITWVSIYTEGTTLKIDVSEAIEKEINLTEDIPSNIVAKKDGVIYYTKTSKGKQVVTIGDVVSKGDILVTGKIELNEDENGKNYSYVKAVSEVRAKTVYDFYYTIDDKVYIEEETGNLKNDYSIYFFGKNYDILKRNINYENFNKTTKRVQLKLSEKYTFPIVITKSSYKELKITTKEKNEEEIKAESNEMLNNLIYSNFDIDADVVEKTINIKKTSQNIEVYSIIYVVENIAEEKVIDYDEVIEKEVNEKINEEEKQESES